ncbi:MAG: sigma factor-like helix-turn-helix DNA-binding protein [Candidatus Gracilibacteria bacterium]|nr:sigma factor-like helix-turn-helix DNA-binding protein [Candidatus Gracilibacteria bacterium]
METMQTKTFNESNIISSFKDILNALSSKEKTVIERRIGLKGEKETLQNIGDSFVPNITRERVRQIEDSGIKKIGRVIKATDLVKIQEYSKEILEEHGGLLTKENLVNAIIKGFELNNEINSSIIETIIQSDYDIVKSKPKLGTRTYFYLPKISKKLVDVIFKEAVSILKKKKDVIDKNSLYELIKINLNNSNVKNVFIDSVLNVYEDIVFGEETLVGLTKWKILNPRTLKDKAQYILRKEKIPMHFVSIANKITETMGEKVKINTVHNELIRNSEFVLVGRGIYALKDWGIYKPGTVLDVIVDIMTKSQDPLTTEDIIAKVLKVRKVKSTTIYMNLQNKKVIQRVGRNYYKLKD